MRLLACVVWLTSWLGLGLCSKNVNIMTNISDPNKDMYVIHATVYQVGIITNKTDDDKNITGKQETITFFKSNGSTVDLNDIPPPLLTNVTAQSLVGVAPAAYTTGYRLEKTLPWNILNNLTSLAPSIQTGKEYLKEATSTRNMRQVADHRRNIIKNNATYSRSTKLLPSRMRLFKRSFLKVNVIKRDMTNDRATPIKITKGIAVIPKEVAVQSIAIPSLLTLNNNLSNIPVPIPNTSVVHYAKIDTLVKMP